MTNNYRIYSMVEKRNAVADARVMRTSDPSMSWQAIANKLDIPLTTLKSWLDYGIDDGAKRGRPPGELAKMVRKALADELDERGIPKREE